MKKAIGIIILGLGLMLVGCAPTASDTKWIKNKTHKYYVGVDPLRGATHSEIKATADQKCALGGEGHAINFKKNQVMVGHVYLFDCSDTEAMEIKKREEEEKKLAEAAETIRLAEETEEEKEQVKITSMIDKAKDTCKDLGFNEGTEKFSDCALKLYSQSVELAAKQNQQVVIQGQSSGSNVMTIYDPVRDNNALIKRGQGLINGTCTLANLSTC